VDITVKAAAISIRTAARSRGKTSRLLETFEYIVWRRRGPSGDRGDDGSTCSVENGGDDEGLEHMHDDESDFANERLLGYL
jgi:hypothetical protein